MVKSGKIRLGKIYFGTEFGKSELACDVFSWLQFAPLHVEHLAHYDKFEYVGISPFFDSIERGMIAKEYELVIEKNKKGKIANITITAN